MIDQKIEKLETKVEAARPPLPPFTKETSLQKVRWPKMPGILVIRKRSRLVIPLIRVGEIEQSFRTAAKRSSNF